MKVFLLTFLILPTVTLASEGAVINEQLQAKLEKHLKEIESQLKHLDWFFKVGYYNEGDDMMMDDVEEFVSNPINTYTMIKRLTLYWPEVRDHLFNQTIIDEWDDILKDLQQLNEISS